jgi:hypothetical protein
MIMENETVKVKGEFIRILQQMENQDWDSAVLTIEAPPFVNKGFSMLPVVKDKKGETMQTYPRPDPKFEEAIYELIEKVNQESNMNQIVFSAKKDDFDHASLDINYSQAIEDNFQNTLPKSKKGKTIAWFKK